MQDDNRQAGGFTLVELAMVMLIIGIIIAGTMKGREMLRNAQVSGTVAQVESIEAAMATFRSTYGDLPGDMPNAAVRLADCAAYCNAAAGAAGNKRIGRVGWGTGWNTQYTQLTNTNSDETAETMLFWLHLDRAEMISGVTPRTAQATGSWGVTNPGTRVGGGFVVGYVDTARPPGAPAATGQIAGHYLALTVQPGSALVATSGQQPLTPLLAFFVDRKADDGAPGGGVVRGYGTQASCYSGAGPVFDYKTQEPRRDCGLLFRIGN